MKLKRTKFDGLVVVLMLSLPVFTLACEAGAQWYGRKQQEICKEGRASIARWKEGGVLPQFSAFETYVLNHTSECLYPYGTN